MNKDIRKSLSMRLDKLVEDLMNIDEKNVYTDDISFLIHYFYHPTRMEFKFDINITNIINNSEIQ